jgi:carboxyl-terminal processing protease
LKITTAKYYTPSGRCIQKVDYAEESDVIKDGEADSSLNFLTDNNREVFSRGGITPDTVVDYSISGNLTRDLLAKGYFFKFASNYYYRGPEKEFHNLKDEELIKEFREYLNSEKYLYQSPAEKEIVKLITEISEKDKKLADELKAIESELEKLYDSEYEVYEDELLLEIKAELAARYIGIDGRIKEQFSQDKQLQIAINILTQQVVYNSLLNVH